MPRAPVCCTELCQYGSGSYWLNPPAVPTTCPLMTDRHGCSAAQFPAESSVSRVPPTASTFGEYAAYPPGP